MDLVTLSSFSMAILEVQRTQFSPAEWLSADVFSEFPLTSVTSPFEATIVCSSLKATDFRREAILCGAEIQIYEVGVLCEVAEMIQLRSQPWLTNQGLQGAASL